MQTSMRFEIERIISGSHTSTRDKRATLKHADQARSILAAARAISINEIYISDIEKGNEGASPTIATLLTPTAFTPPALNMPRDVAEIR